MDPLKTPGRPTHRLPRWQRATLYAAGAVLVLTGGVWLALHYRVGADDLPHPLEAWMLRAHGLAAFAGLFAIGTLAAAHVPYGWRSTRRRRQGQRRTGLGLCILSGLLALTGYALYYFAPETVRPALGWAHAAIGFVMAIVVVWHRRGAR